jgi:hypothetical protein
MALGTVPSWSYPPNAFGVPAMTEPGDLLLTVHLEKQHNEGCEIEFVFGFENGYLPGNLHQRANP